MIGDMMEALDQGEDVDDCDAPQACNGIRFSSKSSLLKVKLYQKCFPNIAIFQKCFPNIAIFANINYQRFLL